eukprot:GILJ01009381.1.p1 GENE.GILJ01009381.1~~GILJ01009381.1.p1  ORF type:complete len:1472 (-),score=206.81 GILJ01009381.1:91-4506(-)
MALFVIFLFLSLWKQCLSFSTTSQTNTLQSSVPPPPFIQQSTPYQQDATDALAWTLDTFLPHPGNDIIVEKHSASSSPFSHWFDDDDDASLASFFERQETIDGGTIRPPAPPKMPKVESPLPPGVEIPIPPEEYFPITIPTTTSDELSELAMSSEEGNIDLSFNKIAYPFIIRRMPLVTRFIYDGAKDITAEQFDQIVTFLGVPGLAAMLPPAVKMPSYQIVFFVFFVNLKGRLKEVCLLLDLKDKWVLPGRGTLSGVKLKIGRKKGVMIEGEFTSTIYPDVVADAKIKMPRPSIWQLEAVTIQSISLYSLTSQFVPTFMPPLWLKKMPCLFAFTASVDSLAYTVNVTFPKHQDADMFLMGAEVVMVKPVSGPTQGIIDVRLGGSLSSVFNIIGFDSKENSRLYGKHAENLDLRLEITSGVGITRLVCSANQFRLALGDLTNRFAPMKLPDFVMKYEVDRMNLEMFPASGMTRLTAQLHPVDQDLIQITGGELSIVKTGPQMSGKFYGMMSAPLPLILADTVQGISTLDLWSAIPEVFCANAKIRFKLAPSLSDFFIDFERPVNFIDFGVSGDMWLHRIQILSPTNIVCFTRLVVENWHYVTGNLFLTSAVPKPLWKYVSDPIQPRVAFNYSMPNLFDKVILEYQVKEAFIYKQTTQYKAGYVGTVYISGIPNHFFSPLFAPKWEFASSVHGGLFFLYVSEILPLVKLPLPTVSVEGSPQPPGVLSARIDEIYIRVNPNPQNITAIVSIGLPPFAKQRCRDLLVNSFPNLKISDGSLDPKSKMIRFFVGYRFHDEFEFLVRPLDSPFDLDSDLLPIGDEMRRLELATAELGDFNITMTPAYFDIGNRTFRVSGNVTVKQLELEHSLKIPFSFPKQFMLDSGYSKSYLSVFPSLAKFVSIENILSNQGFDADKLVTLLEKNLENFRLPPLLEEDVEPVMRNRTSNISEKQKLRLEEMLKVETERQKKQAELLKEYRTKKEAEEAAEKDKIKDKEPKHIDRNSTYVWLNALGNTNGFDFTVNRPLLNTQRVFETSEWRVSEGNSLPDRVKGLLKTLAKGPLPKRFAHYLQDVSIPKQFVYDLDMPVTGGVRINVDLGRPIRTMFYAPGNQTVNETGSLVGVEIGRYVSMSTVRLGSLTWFTFDSLKFDIFSDYTLESWAAATTQSIKDTCNGFSIANVSLALTYPSSKNPLLVPVFFDQLNASFKEVGSGQWKFSARFPPPQISTQTLFQYHPYLLSLYDILRGNDPIDSALVKLDSNRELKLSFGQSSWTLPTSTTPFMLSRPRGDGSAVAVSDHLACLRKPSVSCTLAMLPFAMRSGSRQLKFLHFSTWLWWSYTSLQDYHNKLSVFQSSSRIAFFTAYQQHSASDWLSLLPVPGDPLYAPKQSVSDPTFIIASASMRTKLSSDKLDVALTIFEQETNSTVATKVIADGQLGDWKVSIRGSMRITFRVDSCRSETSEAKETLAGKKPKKQP